MARRTESRKQESVTMLWQSPSDREEIARVAHELFERRGRAHGHDQQDWFEAERIIAQRTRSGNGR